MEKTEDIYQFKNGQIILVNSDDPLPLGVIVNTLNNNIKELIRLKTELDSQKRKVEELRKQIK